MVKRRKKIIKIKNYLNSKILTKIIREAMIDKLSFEEMLDTDLKTGYEEEGWLWDKNDPTLNKAYWDKFGDLLMKWWRDHKIVGKRPWLFYKVYSEKPKILYLTLRECEPELFEDPPYPDEDDTKYEIYEAQEDFLRRMGLLEDWEIKEIEKQKSEGTYKKFEDRIIYKNIEYEKSNYFD